MTQVLAWLSEAMQTPHVYVDRRGDRVCGAVLYALAIGSQLCLVCRDDDAPEPRNVMAPLSLWDADNAIEALETHTPVLTIRELGRSELETYFGVRPPVPAARSTARPSTVSHVGGQA